MADAQASRLALLVDLGRCTGCQACALACKAEMQVPVGSFFSWVKSVELGRYPDTRRLFLPMTCNQCAEPSCERGCPVKATYRHAGGIVRVDPHRCIGCKYCFWTCPYGVRILDEELGICRKCELCVHRLDKGQPPACVEACPTGCLVFGDRADTESEISRRLAAAPRAWLLQPELGNGPQVFYLGLGEVPPQPLLLAPVPRGAGEVGER